MKALYACGYNATQATISRDIKELNLVKQQVGGVNKYVVAQPRHPHHAFSSRLRSIFRESVTAFDAAQNIVVVKTFPGLASAAAAALDSMEVEGLVGSLAGDDTVLMIMRNHTLADEFCSDIKSMLE